jgi:hypothetical protein
MSISASPRSIWPPVSSCFNPECSYVLGQKQLKLQGAEERNVVLYTCDGPIAVKYIHISCDGESFLVLFDFD